MSEFITIQVGQCGNQIGSAFWPHVLQEYGIQIPRESGYWPRNQHHQVQPRPHLNDAFHSFFYCPDGDAGTTLKTLRDLENAKIKARAVCIDMEDSVVARYRSGHLRNLFDAASLLTNYPGSANNWAEGHLTHGIRYRDKISNLLRHTVECCDQLHGFLLLFSLGGGTGSGLGTAVLDLLEEQYPHIDRLVTCVYPGGIEDVITAPYNVILSMKELTDHASCVLPVDNKALLDICSRLRSGHGSSDMPKKPFDDMNTVVVNMLLHLTSGSRFPGTLNVDMNEVATNLVPFPGLQYISSSLSPLSSAAMLSLPPGRSMKSDEMFNGVWSRDNQLVKLDTLGGILLGTAFIARGALTLSDVRRNVARLQEKAKFISWNHNAVKVGMCSVPPPGLSSSLLGLFNTSSMVNLFKDVVQKFNKLYCRKAHVHHYLQVDGFSENHFKDSLNSIQDIISSYKELETREPIVLPRMQVL
ncbi:tubulin epsilon chain isoform X1 [Anabrus simplex]|uniref:tubulin epsilon chain isoform X1 n=1 Tax=Anabrus simplex TaxID=316456 RepID=UPI0035A3036F